MAARGTPFPPEWDAFLEDMQWELLPSSFKTLKFEIIRWHRWLQSQNLEWQAVQTEHAHQWLHAFLETSAHSTVTRRLWPLRRLYQWAQQAGHIGTNPFAWITRPIFHNRYNPHFMPTEKQVLHLLAMPDTSTYIGIRDRAILELLYASGLRAGELLSLSTADVSGHFRQRAIRVWGKGKIERFVVYHETAQYWLGVYLQRARHAILERAGTPQQTQCFVALHGQHARMSYQTLRRLVRRYADAAGLPFLTAHSLRHAFATHLYCNGAPMDIVQKLLGHRNIETTALYIQLSAQYLREQHWRCHPRGSAGRRHVGRRA